MGFFVGGPDLNDNFSHERDNYEQTEPATYNNGPLIGTLARINGGASYNRLLPVVPNPKNKPQPSPSPSTKPQPSPSPATKPKPYPSPAGEPKSPNNPSLLVSQVMTSS